MIKYLLFGVKILVKIELLVLFSDLWSEFVVMTEVYKISDFFYNIDILNINAFCAYLQLYFFLAKLAKKFLKLKIRFFINTCPLDFLLNADNYICLNYCTQF